MALNDTDQNFISRGKAYSKTLLDLRADFEIELGRWNLSNMFTTMNDVDIQAKFPGLNKGKVIAYVNVIKALLAALGTVDGNGDPVHNDTASQAANLIGMLE